MSNVVSETYILGVDISSTDESVVVVARRIGNVTLESIKTITGTDAEKIYELISDKKIEGKPVVVTNGKYYCPYCVADINGFGKVKHCTNCGREMNWNVLKEEY